MTRFLKKCIFLSVGLHVVVAALLIAAAAFFITKPEKVTPTRSMSAPEVLENLLHPPTAPAQARVTPSHLPAHRRSQVLNHRFAKRPAAILHKHDWGLRSGLAQEFHERHTTLGDHCRVHVW